MLSSTQNLIFFTVGLFTIPTILPSLYPYFQTSSQSPGGLGLAGRANVIPWCPARLLGPPVKDLINWSLFEARVGLGGFLPPPLFPGGHLLVE